MHPFRTAVENRDLDAVEALLAEDVVFTSPVAFRPYPGKALTAAILRGVLRVFSDFRYVREIEGADGRDHALVFTAKVGDKEINGCDFLHFDEEGRIDEFTVMVRPSPPPRRSPPPWAPSSTASGGGRRPPTCGIEPTFADSGDSGKVQHHLRVGGGHARRDTRSHPLERSMYLIPRQGRHLEASSSGGRTVVALRGELDLVLVRRLRPGLDALVREADVLTLDIRGLTFCDASGLGLSSAALSARAHGARAGGSSATSRGSSGSSA